MSILVTYDEDEKEVRISGFDPDGSDVILGLDEAFELHDALSDAIPDPDDMSEDDLDMDDDEDDDDTDEEYTED